VGRRKLVLKAIMAADILISCFTNVFIVRIIFGTASTQLCGLGCARNRCATMRCKTSQQPLSDGKYTTEKLATFLLLLKSTEHTPSLSDWWAAAEVVSVGCTLSLCVIVHERL